MPDENNIARLQEELIAVKLREAEALMGLKELRQQVKDLEEHWQVSLEHLVIMGKYDLIIPVQMGFRGGY